MARIRSDLCSAPFDLNSPALSPRTAQGGGVRRRGRRAARGGDGGVLCVACGASPGEGSCWSDVPPPPSRAPFVLDRASPAPT
eukprot:3312549-Prymnesium_polylepis.1